MPATLSSISHNLVKTAILFSSLNLTTVKASKTGPSNSLFFLASSNRRPTIITLAAQLLAHNQSKPTSKAPPEFPPNPDNDDLPYSVPPEAPELPKTPEIETNPPDEEYIEIPTAPELPGPGPDFPVPPSPSPPTPDIPLPPPGTPRPPPPDQVPPEFPPDPEIIPPPTPTPPDILPPPDTPPDIKPPPGPFVF